MYLNDYTKLSNPPQCGKNTDQNCPSCCPDYANVGSSNIRPNHPDPDIDCDGKCNPQCVPHNPLHTWLIKYAVQGETEKFIGQAYVIAHNIKEAQCIFGTQSCFNGFQERLKITSMFEVPPCPEPVLVQEDSVAIIDRKNLKTYPFLLKSDFQIFVNDIHKKIIDGFRTPSHLIFNINGVEVGDYHPLHDVNTVINLNNVTVDDDGLMSKEDKLKLDSLGLDTTSAEALTTSDNELFNNVIQLHKISKTGTFSDLLDIPNGKLTIKKNDTVIDEFTDNANEDKEISLIVNDGELNIKYGDTSLGTFTADQANDSIINLPLIKHKGTLINIDNNNSLDIPTEINDATQTNTDTWSSNKIHSEIDNSIGKGELIIQKNGTNLPVNYGNNQTKQAFGANDFDYCIVNIPVPTRTSELTNNGEGVQDYPFITKAVNNLENYYTEAEVDNLLSQLETNIDWKEAVNTYADIATTYPNPQDGWTVNVKDTDYTYRYNGTEWVAISANAIPLATQSINGLMSATDKTKLDGIATGAEVNVQSDWNQTNTQADSYIKNKPTIPTVNNGTLTIKQNNANKGTFTANQSGNTTIELTDTTYSSKTAVNGGTDVSLVTTGEKYTWNNKGNGTVTQVKIGSTEYNPSGGIISLPAYPTVPTVNNATLTIQKNGTTVKTFTANASSNVTANITVPTKVSELTNDSGYTANTGTVTQVKVGTTAYNPSNGVVSLPAYTNDTGATSVQIMGNGNVVTTASYSASNRKLLLLKEITTLVAGDEGETAITDNSNLNNYTTVGTYGTAGGHGGSTTAASLINKPTFSGGFRMYVESCGGDGSYVRQTIITKAGLTFVRTGNLNNSTWTTWEQIRGLSYGSSTTTFLRNDGTWQVPQDDTKVAKVGDTMTGNLQITKGTGNVSIRLSSTACDGLSTLLTVVAAGNHGIYSEGYWNGSSYTTSGKWLISRDNNNVVKINGTLTCPNKTGILATLDDIVSDTNTTYTFATGDSNGQIKVTPSSGSAYNVNVKGLGSAAYTDTEDFWRLGRGIQIIPASSTNPIDLNDYVDSGNYTCQKTADAGYVTNHPDPANHAGFNLVVMKSLNSNSYIRQIVLLYNENSLYMRTSSNSGATWTSWRNLANNTTYSAGDGLNLANGAFSVTYGTAANTACQGNDSRLSDTRTPKAHNQASNTINAMTGYSKPSTTSAIATSDTLNSAIGKLEKGLESAIDALPSAGWTKTINIVGSTVEGLTYSCNGYGRVCCGYVHFKPLVSNNITTTILRIPNVQASHHVIFPALLSDGDAHIELRIVSDLTKSYTDIEIWGSGPSAVAGRYYTGHFSFVTT